MWKLGSYHFSPSLDVPGPGDQVSPGGVVGVHPELARPAVVSCPWPAFYCTSRILAFLWELFIFFGGGGWMDPTVGPSFSTGKYGKMKVNSDLPNRNLEF